MSKRTPPEEAMATLLRRAGLPFVEQARVSGHRIDFVVVSGGSPLLVDTNGDRWHHWSKIVESDRVKLDRMLAAGWLPLGVWWSRLERSPDEVLEGIRWSFRHDRLAWWDWAVPIESLQHSARAKSLVRRG